MKWIKKSQRYVQWLRNDAMLVRNNRRFYVSQKIRKLQRSAARQLSSRANHRTLVLAYHRISNLSEDPWSLNVRPHHFAEHLEVLRQYAYPINLQRLSQGLCNGNLPARSIVVTFDDGYMDNFYNAKLLLERYDTPATV